MKFFGLAGLLLLAGCAATRPDYGKAERASYDAKYGGRDFAERVRLAPVECMVEGKCPTSEEIGAKERAAYAEEGR